VNAADYRRRANIHRPTDPQSIARAVHQLRRQGLKPRDIGEWLRIPLENVVNILGELHREQ
jgi:hypothetical protein